VEEIATITLYLLEIVAISFAIFHFYKSHADPAWVVETSYPSMGNFDIRSLGARKHAKRLVDRKRFGCVALAIVGYAVLTYHAVYGVIGFLPASLGGEDEYGEFVSLRTSVATTLAGISGLGLPMLLLRSAKRKMKPSTDGRTE
jgi:hypothetical protein